jgi:putative membrane protein
MVDWGREAFLLGASIVYAVLGGVLLLVAYRIFDLTTPHDLSELIFDRGNMAAAVMSAGFLIALAIIIAAAIH